MIDFGAPDDLAVHPSSWLLHHTEIITVFVDQGSHNGYRTLQVDDDALYTSGQPEAALPCVLQYLSCLGIQLLPTQQHIYWLGQRHMEQEKQRFGDVG